MNTDASQIVCGTIDKPDSSADISISAPLSDVSAAQWNQQLASTTSEYFAITDQSRPVTNEEIQQGLERLQTDSSLKGILLFSVSSAESLSFWRTLPTCLAALTENVAQRVGAVVFRVSALKELGFAEVSDPIWDVVIRAAGELHSIHVAELSGDFSGRGKSELPDLAPDSPGNSRRWLKSHLDAISLDDLVSEVTSSADAVALQAGFLQVHDFLDASHQLSQKVEGQGRHAAGDYWHAIMHRREPDYANAKYWFRSVGSHPVYPRLRDAVDSLLAQTDNTAADAARQKLSVGNHWDPFAFVDFCQECEHGQDLALTEIAQQIQWWEMQLLLEQTYFDATS